MAIQISNELLDACVLSLIEKEDLYGYILTQRVQEHISISESTLYPVLRRLMNKDLLESYDVALQGRNRRYYKLTKLGEVKLHEYKLEWEAYKKTVDKFLKIN